MKKIIFIIAALMLSAFAASAQDVLGKWKLETGTAIVQVYQSGENFNGKIVWLQKATEADGSPAVDKNNPDPAKQSRKLIATPSITARTKCALVWRALMPIKLPRRAGFACGVNSPIR